MRSWTTSCLFIDQFHFECMQCVVHLTCAFTFRALSSSLSIQLKLRAAEAVGLYDKAQQRKRHNLNTFSRFYYRQSQPWRLEVLLLPPHHILVQLPMMLMLLFRVVRWLLCFCGRRRRVNLRSVSAGRALSGEQHATWRQRQRRLIAKRLRMGAISRIKHFSLLWFHSRRCVWIQQAIDGTHNPGEKTISAAIYRLYARIISWSGVWLTGVLFLIRDH